MEAPWNTLKYGGVKAQNLPKSPKISRQKGGILGIDSEKHGTLSFSDKSLSVHVNPKLIDCINTDASSMCQVLLPLLQDGGTHFRIKISQRSPALASSILAQLSLNTLPLEIQKIHTYISLLLNCWLQLVMNYPQDAGFFFRGLSPAGYFFLDNNLNHPPTMGLS